MSFIARNPALIPLFAAVGGGVGFGLVFGGYYLGRSPDVIVDKRRALESKPWNRVEQHMNTKLLTINKDFFQNRISMPHPQAMFMQDEFKAEKSQKKH